MNAREHGRPASPALLVLGLGVGALPPDLASRPELAGADCIVGPHQALALLETLPAEKLPVSSKLDALLGRMEELLRAGARVVVLTTGDPLFFGFGATLARRFGPGALDIRPAPSALQTAAARLGLPWDGVASVSLHGRSSYLPLAHAVMRDSPVCVLTGEPGDIPAVASWLRERGAGDYRLHVFGRLGFPEESHADISLEEAETLCLFPSPVTLFLVPDASGGTAPQRPVPQRPVLGRPDEEYARERGLISKWPVRAAVLAALRIAPEHCVWDIGSGSGAVAVEAAALAHRGRVVALEKNPARAAHIRENRRRFRAVNLDIAEGPAPDVFPELPDPDRAFIGGGLGASRDVAGTLVRAVWERLPEGGRVVAACVLLESLEIARALLGGLAGSCETVCLGASHAVPLGTGTHLAAQNPVFLVAAEKRAV